MNNQPRRFRLGVFVLTALLLLAILITLFGGYPGLFRQYDRYTVIFDNAPGVAEGTPVRRSGVRIGLVQRVNLDDATGKVSIVILIEKPHPLYQTDQAILVHGLLSGDTSIDFVPRKEDGQVAQLTPLSPGSEFGGTTQPEVSTLLSQTSNMVPDAQDTLNDIRKILQRYERMAPLVEDTLKEYRDLGKAAREAVPDIREVIRSVRDLMPDVRRTNDELQVTIRNWGRVGERIDVWIQTNQDRIGEAIEEFIETTSRVGRLLNDENQKHVASTLKHVDDTTKNLDSLVKNTDDMVKEGRQSLQRFQDSMKQADQVLGNLQQATRPAAERSAAITRNLDEGLEKFNRTLGDAREMIRVIGQGDGTLRRFVEDPALYNNINELVSAVGRILPRLDRVLHDLETFADKIARHPESLGIRGAIRPDSGLKEVPPAGIYPHQ